MVFQAFRTLCDGLSRTKIPMYATLISNALNILFNYLFIFGNWGFPALGVLGAGYGTLISRVLMVLLSLLYFIGLPISESLLPD